MLKYWVWLTLCRNLGPRQAALLLQYFGTVEAIYLADEADYSKVEGLDRRCVQSLLDKDLDRAEQILEDCYERRVSILSCQDAGYPQRLQNIQDPPVLLYYRGRVPAVDEEPVIGVVGSRNCTPYGLLCAKRISYHAACCGCMIASGGARGIDTMALRGALSADKPAICVLGCGVDIAYPRENEDLFRDIEVNGWLVSEYPPGTPPEGRHFPVRNRIISGLSVGVLVVEAGEHSGALITARHALEQGRDVFAVPGNIGVPSSKGSNGLIKDGAIVAEHGWDIAREYEALFPEKIRDRRPSHQQILTTQERAYQPAREKVPKAEVAQPVRKLPKTGAAQLSPKAALEELDAAERAVWETLAAGRLHVDAIIAQTGLRAPEVLSALTMMEVKGLVEAEPGKYFSRAN